MDLPICQCGRVHECDCGDVHEFAHAVRGDFERAIRKHGPLIEVNMCNNGSPAYLIPRIWIAAHGLQAVELGYLAVKYGWQRVG